jgi:hypothetical protein
MPYSISKSGRGYKVKKVGSKKTYSKKALSKKKATAQMLALYSAEKR